MNRPAFPRALALALVACLAAPFALHAETCVYPWLCVGDASNADLPSPWQGQALGAHTIALNGIARTDGSIAIGGDAGYNVANNDDPAGWSANTYATAIGGGSRAWGSFSAAFGAGAMANSANSLAVGPNARADGSNSGWIRATAIGPDASASNTEALAVGPYAQSNVYQGTALGPRAVASEANTVSFGSDGSLTSAFQRRLVNVAPGVLPTDVVTVSQLMPVSAFLGGGSSVVAGVIQAPTYSLQSGTYHDVGSALTALDEKPVSAGSSPVWLASSDTTTPATATGLRSITVGPGAITPAENAVTLGNGSAGTQDNTVSFGSDGTVTPFLQRRLVNVSDGIAPNDAMTMRQGARIASYFGGGVNYLNGAGPSFALSGGTFTDVGSALSYLDGKASGGEGGTGPMGPQGPKGDKGDTGPQGATTPGSGHDDLAVHYDDATEATATLGGSGGTTVKNVRAGVDQTDAANVGQVQAAVQQSQSYTDNSVAAAKDWSKAYTDQRVDALNHSLNKKINAAGAVGSVFGQMALSAGSVPQQDKLSMGIAGYKGESAIGVAYTHRFENDRVAVSVGAAFAGSSGSAVGVSVSVGLGGN